MKALGIFHNYRWGVGYYVGTDPIMLVYQLIIMAKDPEVAPAISWMASTRLGDFNLEHVLGRTHCSADVLLHWQGEAGKSDSDKGGDVEETSKASIQGIQVEQGPFCQKREKS